MPPDSSPSPEAEAFIARWKRSGGHERAAAQLFLTELCDLLDLPHADPPSKRNHENSYCFERAVPHLKSDGSKTTRYIDCYKRQAFVLETKQGIDADETDDERLQLKLRLDQNQHSSTSLGHGRRGSSAWDTSMEKAKKQAEGYIRDLPPEEGRPPFLIVCDVGHVIELYAEFSQTGGSYVRFPDPKSHRIFLEDLADPDKQALLRAIWTDPLSLDPSKHAAAVTREIASHLAALAKSLETDGHHPQEIATLLQRCLFTMFAEDVGLLPKNGFLDLLEKIKDSPQGFATLVRELWKEMAKGTEFSTVLFQKIAYFNGGLFENITVPELAARHIQLLIAAARSDWSAVEPAIFGTLLERALTPEERHKLGAHYTPRSYVERLVKPTIIDPLREQWDTVKAEAAQFEKTQKRASAIAAVREFHHELCRIRVLDPACGSGNFLYVTLEHMKRLEGEVIELLQQLGDTELTFEMEEFKVRPQQFLGLEINERAVAIAQLVLWIGYFQWHKRATGSADTNDRPLIPKTRSIVQQDAVLAYDDWTYRKDADGSLVTIWNGRTTKPHPVTGKEVPDETATKPVLDYINPRRAGWPDADYIVGNPPFIGASRMRDLLGDGYTEALRKVWKGDVPESADFVMFWWQKAAELVRAGKTKRFGFITTNSIHQTFNRRVIEPHLADEKAPLHLAYAIPDHPWVDSTSGAAVRIAMTVATSGQGEGRLEIVTAEHELPDGEHGVTLTSKTGYLISKLNIGANVSLCAPLQSNLRVSCRGYTLSGTGFLLSKDDAKDLEPDLIKQFLGGRDLAQTSRSLLAIDAFGLSERDLINRYPRSYQHLRDRVKPIREANNRESYRRYWWLYAEPRASFRPALNTLDHIIVTPRTARHRYFAISKSDIVFESEIVLVAVDDISLLGTLSSSIHGIWALEQGGKMGVGNDPRYNDSRCFQTFPFPDLEDGELKIRIRKLGEQLDQHRKDRQAEHAALTMTGMYNVLEKLRKEEALTEKEIQIHRHGLVSVLKNLHDQIDAAVLEAYGWQDLADATPLADRLARGDEALEQAILTRLVALNHQRAAEEQRGIIRYLRPEYQNPNYQSAPKREQSDLAIESVQPAEGKAAKRAWPKTTREQIAVLKDLIPSIGPDSAALSVHFGKRAPKREVQIQDLLHTLEDLGQL